MAEMWELVAIVHRRQKHAFECFLKAQSENAKNKDRVQKICKKVNSRSAG